MSAIQSVKIPASIVRALKSLDKEAPTGLYTPEDTPEPVEIPETNAEPENKEKKLKALIERVENTPSNRPLHILGVRTTEDFKSEVPHILEFLKTGGTKESRDALSSESSYLV